MHEGLMVSVSGIRGRIGEALTPEVVARYAAAFGVWACRTAGTLRIVVGRDTRVSGPMLHRVVLAALESVGCEVVDVGIAATPTIQLAVEDTHAAGGLAITASHNPVEWNALKFIGSSGRFLDADEGASMRAVADAVIPRVRWDALGTVRGDDGATGRHIERILGIPFLDVSRIRARRFHVALDCVRGAGGVIIPPLLERFGCRVTAINLELDGRFPRPPEPVAENLGGLEALVRECGADVGIAIDPDADRMAIVSEVGHAIGEDYTLALASRLVLRYRPGPVVANLSTSLIVDEVAAEAGSAVIRAPVGEANVAARMRNEGAAIGGEGNGGVILSEVHLGRDAPVAVALLLQMMVEDDEPISATTARYGEYRIVKDKLDRPNASLEAVYDTLRQSMAEAAADTQDGLRLAWADRWLHVRPSGTEPIVRVIAEAPTEADARLLIARAREPLAALR
ncbi:MAG TPA: phosphoglucosamine mutase [Gemmatimonadaceae bacterium]|nr:phosphoglucosamine mutase [Gemmatimonadaceae bacterium]